MEAYLYLAKKNEKLKKKKKTFHVKNRNPSSFSDLLFY